MTAFEFILWLLLGFVFYDCIESQYLLSDIFVKPESSDLWDWIVFGAFLLFWPAILLLWGFLKLGELIEWIQQRFSDRNRS